MFFLDQKRDAQFQKIPRKGWLYFKGLKSLILYTVFITFLLDYGLDFDFPQCMNTQHDFLIVCSENKLKVICYYMEKIHFN